MLTARRDNYVARTFSHMARARLDHAVSRSADLEFLGSEKWEMRCAHDLCLSMKMPLPDPMRVEVWQMADCACLHSLALLSSTCQSGPSALRHGLGQNRCIVVVCTVVIMIVMGYGYRVRVQDHCRPSALTSRALPVQACGRWPLHVVPVGRVRGGRHLQGQAHDVRGRHGTSLRVPARRGHRPEVTTHS